MEFLFFCCALPSASPPLPPHLLYFTHTHTTFSHTHRHNFFILFHTHLCDTHPHPHTTLARAHTHNSVTQKSFKQNSLARLSQMLLFCSRCGTVCRRCSSHHRVPWWHTFGASTWWFPEIGVPQNGWFIVGKPTRMDDDWGYPHFRKPPNLLHAKLWSHSAP